MVEKSQEKLDNFTIIIISGWVNETYERYNCILNGKIQREDKSIEAYRTQPSDLSHRLMASVPV